MAEVCKTAVDSDNRSFAGTVKGVRRDLVVTPTLAGKDRGKITA